MVPGKQYKPEDVLRMAWHRRWVILLPFIAITVAGMAMVWKLPNRFKSETLILVVPQRVPESFVRSTVTSRIEDRLRTISPQILSRPRLEQIINGLDLYAIERQTRVMEEVVDQMRGDIEVQVVRGDAFRISYVAAEPEITQQVVEQLAGLFIDENLRDREMQAQGTSDFLAAQLEDARKRLIENERRVSQYERAHAQELPSQLAFNQQAAHHAQMQVQAVLDSLNRDRERRLLLERQIAAGALEREATLVPASDAMGGGPLTPAEALNLARAELNALELRLTPEHPDVKRQMQRVAELESQVALAPALDPTPFAGSPSGSRTAQISILREELEQIKAQIATKEQEEKRLRSTIEVYQQRIQAAPLRASELAELTRDHETLQQIYRNLLQKREDSSIAANLEHQQIGEQFRVLEPANLPERPFSPNRRRLAAMFALFGLVCGVSLAALLEYFDTALRSEEDVAVALRLRVLATVPLVGGPAPRRRFSLDRFGRG